MSNRWFIARTSENEGPFSLDQLKDLAAIGRLTPADVLVVEGTQTELPATSLGLVFPESAVTSEPAAIRTAKGDQAFQDDFDAPPAEPPALWNPTAAIWWSLVFSPIFGASLHALNWRTLGNTARARANWAWVVATIALLVFLVGIEFFPHPDAIDKATRPVGLVLFVLWYGTQGKYQGEYVWNTFPDGYRRRSWFGPFAVAISSFAAFMAILFVVVYLTYEPDAEELADEVKPMILDEWHKKPELKDAMIVKVTLDRKEGKKHFGHVDAILEGKPEHLKLEVEYENEMIKFKIEP